MIFLTFYDKNTRNNNENKEKKQKKTICKKNMRQKVYKCLWNKIFFVTLHRFSQPLTGRRVACERCKRYIVL